MFFFKNNSNGKNYHVFLAYFQSKDVKDLLREMDIWILYFKLACTSSPFHANPQMCKSGLKIYGDILNNHRLCTSYLQRRDH